MILNLAAIRLAALFAGTTIVALSASTAAAKQLRGHASKAPTSSRRIVEGLDKWIRQRNVLSAPSSRHLSAPRMSQVSLQSGATFPNGIWLSNGYGYVIASDGENVTGLEVTNSSCIEASFLEDIDDFVVKAENVVEVHHGSVVPMYFFLQESLPGACGREGLTPVVGDPDYVPDNTRTLEILVQTFEEHYAFFEERGVDWDSMVATAMVTAAGDDSDSLGDAVLELLLPFQDIHITVDVPGIDDTLYMVDVPIFDKLALEWEEQIQVSASEATSVASNPNDYILQQLGVWLGGVAGYLEDDTLNGNPDYLIWGKFKHANIGYMCMLSMDPDHPELAIKELMEAAAALHDADGIIFDIRMNTGGTDLWSMFVASFFATETFRTFEKRAIVPDYNGNRRSATHPIPVMLDPLGDAELQLTSNVVLLTSESTISAGEVFAMAMKGMPQVTVMGHNTHGAFSDMLSRTLDNGWQVTLSNEIYIDHERVVREVSGLPPDVVIETEVLPLAERENGEDSWIVAALEQLNAPLSTSAPTIYHSSVPTELPTDKATESPTAADGDGNGPTDVPSSAPTDKSSGEGTSRVRLVATLAMLLASALMMG